MLFMYEMGICYRYYGCCCCCRCCLSHFHFITFWIYINGKSVYCVVMCTARFIGMYIYFPLVFCSVCWIHLFVRSFVNKNWHWCARDVHVNVIMYSITKKWWISYQIYNTSWIQFRFYFYFYSKEFGGAQNNLWCSIECCRPVIFYYRNVSIQFKPFIFRLIPLFSLSLSPYRCLSVWLTHTMPHHLFAEQTKMIFKSMQYENMKIIFDTTKSVTQTRIYRLTQCLLNWIQWIEIEKLWKNLR